MSLAEEHLASLDAGRDHKAHAAFTRLVKEPEAPVHANDVRPIVEWLCGALERLSEQLGQLAERLGGPIDRIEDLARRIDDVAQQLNQLRQRQDANHHNPVEPPDPEP